MVKDLSKSYFDWIFWKVCDNNSKANTHIKLLETLFSKPFQVTNPRDFPRESDGIDLRWRYQWEIFYGNKDFDASQYIFNSHVPEDKCSILEMMVALAYRADENFTRQCTEVTSVPDVFWDMIKNMGLLAEVDLMFDEERTNEILDRFNNLQYDPDGYGGLFFFDNIDEDVRKVEIWYQLCWYINARSK